MKRFAGILLMAGFCIIATLRLTYLMETSGEPYRQYLLRSTRLLISSVTNARMLLAKQGPDAFLMLDTLKPEHPDIYLYVYRRADGRCLYHGNNPALVGHCLDTFTDQLGKPIHHLILSQIQNPLNPHGWVHFFWHRPDGLFLEWKSTCNQPVTLPDGTECYVGGGLYGLGAEPEFARIAVSEAVQLLEADKDTALTRLVSPASEFFFYGTSVFVIRTNGESVIDPILKKQYQRDLKPFKDAAGNHPFQLLLSKLETAPETRVILYQRSAGSMNLDKKILYAQKGKMGEETVILGTVIDAPQSIWQK